MGRAGRHDRGGAYLRSAWLWLGLALVLVAIFLPTGWYEHLPQPQKQLPEPPVKGVTLVRLAFGLEGLLLLILALRAGSWRPIQREDCLQLPEPDIPRGGDLRHPAAWVAAITLLAAGLRLANVGSDLWMDEIATVLDYQEVSAFHVLTGFISANNHLLNTLLVKAMVGVVGMKEWAIRLPAVLFGIAAIPAQYALARLALSRRDAVLAALLLAVSYHHVFFSQNARGYSGLLLWSMLGTTFFLRGVSHNRARDWALYVLAMFLAVATMLFGIFVLAGHGLAFLAVLWALRRRGQPLGPLSRKVLAIGGILGILCFHLYASILPQAYVYIGSTFQSQTVELSPVRLTDLGHWWRGLSAGFGAGATAALMAALAIMTLGFVSFFRRHMVYSITLISPLAATLLFMLAASLRFSPRFFLWALPVGFIFAVATVLALAQRIGTSRRLRSAGLRRLATRAPLALVGLLCLLSLVSLRNYYRVPKQPTRRSLEWVRAQQRPEDLVMAFYNAGWGLRFYGPGLGMEEGKSYFVFRSLEEMESVEEQNAGRKIWLLTTFERAVRIWYPEVDRHVREHYRLERVFPATVENGEISVWTR